MNEKPEECDANEEKADLATTTPSGCTCASTCHANWKTYDWCKTEGNCGKYYYGGFYYWDKCMHVAEADPNYNDLNWNEKQTHIWNRVLSNNEIRPPLSMAETLTEFFSQSWPTGYENEWDVKPVGSQKVLHPLGSICPIVFKIRNSNFTGILKNGEHHGIVRLGSTRYPEKGTNLIAGAAIKIFRTGKASANMVLFRDGDFFEDLEGSHDFNFFKFTLSNHLLGCKYLVKKIVNFKMGKDVGCPLKAGLSDLCTYDQEGKTAKDVVFPYKVYLTE